MGFAAIRDQDAALTLLRNILRRRRIPHGLLFWGPGGVGKRTTAFEFAKAINCLQGGFDACDVCLSCRKVKSGNHPDVTVVAPLRKKTRIIEVEAVDMMNEQASLRPFEGRWRVFVIQEAERMHPAAQNHFLKTIEEPPGNSVFILLSEHPKVLLPTIRSRCQRVRFGALRPGTVVELLQRQRDLPDDIARAIAAVAQGQMSRALEMIDSEKRDIVLSIARRLSAEENPVALADEFARHLDARREQLQVAARAEFEPDDRAGLTKEEREDIKQQQEAFVEATIRHEILEYLYLFSTWYRDQMVFAATGGVDFVFNRDRMDAEKAEVPRDYEAKLAAIEKSRVYLERNLKEDRVFRDLFFVLAD